LLRVAIIEGLTRIVVMRDASVTVVAMPPLMHIDDVVEQTCALYHDWEGATFRAYYDVPHDDKAAGWRQVIPTLVCPCLTPPPLRLAPWPPCPAHDTGRTPLPIAESVENALRALSVEP
jgi:hypothetical protein